MSVCSSPLGSRFRPGVRLCCKLCTCTGCWRSFSLLYGCRGTSDSFDISTFSDFFWNLYFLFSVLLKSTFCVLFYSNLYSLFPFLLTSLLFYWNLSFLFTFLLKSVLALYFSILKSLLSIYFLLCAAFHAALQPTLSPPPKIRTRQFQSHGYAQHSAQDCGPQLLRTWNFKATAMQSIPRSVAAYNGFPQPNYAHENFKEKLRPACHAALRRNRATTNVSNAFATVRVKTQRFARFLTFKLAHCPTLATQTATTWLN